MNNTMAADATATMEFSKLTKFQKLAAFLLILKPENAAQIMGQLEEAELEAVSAEIAKFTNISQELQAEILREFSPVALEAATSIRGGVGSAKHLLEKSVGVFRASDILCRVAPAQNQVAAMEQIVEIDPRQLYNVLRHEQLQTIALVASYMSPDKASQLLSLLRPELRAQVVERLAGMAPTSIEIVESVAEMLQKKLTNNRAGAVNQTGGVKAAAQLLNAFSRDVSDSVLISLKERNAELGEAVMKKMFTFDELERLNPQTLQKILQEVDIRMLSVALKSAGESVKTALFACLSKRAAENLREEISFLGPLKLSQIEEAQGHIIESVKQLEASGEIDLDELRQATV
jgi:flagellar motor switch protein FliG